MENADAVGTVGSPDCGDMLRMWIKFKEEDGRKIIDRATLSILRLPDRNRGGERGDGIARRENHRGGEEHVRRRTGGTARCLAAGANSLRATRGRRVAECALRATQAAADASRQHRDILHHTDGLKIECRRNTDAKVKIASVLCKSCQLTQETHVRKHRIHPEPRHGGNPDPERQQNDDPGGHAGRHHANAGRQLHDRHVSGPFPNRGEGSRCARH